MKAKKYLDISKEVEIVLETDKGEIRRKAKPITRPKRHILEGICGSLIKDKEKFTDKVVFDFTSQYKISSMKLYYSGVLIAMRLLPDFVVDFTDELVVEWSLFIENGTVRGAIR